MKKYQLEESNRLLAEALRQRNEAQGLLEIEEANRAALIGLHSEWKAELKAASEADRQQLQAELDRALAELAELREKAPPATEQPPIDLSEQIPQIINFLKQELPLDTKWPKRIMPKLREFLESKED
ncbi:hypothetical protein [Microcoleus sp. T3_D1]|uniref:hypothetical protein n=1 Tax=Microcoleus sp. T3_D1 TaxID=3055427 RepID=UPI002FD463DF